MSSGAIPKKKKPAKNATTKNEHNTGAPTTYVVTARHPGDDMRFVKKEGKDDKLVSQAINEAFRILESKARRKYGNFSQSSFCQNQGEECLIKQVFVEPILYKQEMGNSESPQKKVKLENILSSSSANDSPPKRILLIGNPGFGKSSLSTKIVNSWAVRAGCYSDRFRLVILYSLSKLESAQILQDALLNEFAKNISSELPLVSAERILNTIMDELLIVLDGYDEIIPENRSEVGTLLSKNSFFSSATILVTSRPDALQSRFKSSFQRLVTIYPLDSERRDLLVDKYFKTQPEKAKLIKQFLKEHTLRPLTCESLQSLSIVLHLFEKNIINFGQRDSDIVFEMSREMIVHASQKDNPGKHVDSEKVTSTIYRFSKLLLGNMKASQNGLQESETDVLGSLKEAVRKSGLFQVKVLRNEVFWEIKSKGYLICLSVYYLNEKLKKLKAVSDVHEFLRKHLGDPRNVATIIFKKGVGYLALWGSPKEIVYLCQGTHSVFNGCFMSILNLKEVFGDFACKFKDSSIPCMYAVYSKRKSAVSLSETFANMVDGDTKAVNFHLGKNRQHEAVSMVQGAERFALTGYIRFSFAIEDTVWGAKITQHNCGNSCAKLTSLSSVILKEDLLKAQKHKTWNLILFQKSNCFIIEPTKK